MANSRAGLFVSFWDDGFRYLRVIAPLTSISFTLLKALEFPVHLKEWSYAWALLPLLIWVVVAYVRRWKETERLESLIESKILLGFDASKCIRDVLFPQGGMSRYISVTVRGRGNASIPDTSVYLHSVEHIAGNGIRERVDIEGSPPLEWAQSPGRVMAHDPRTLHAGREALVNILFCTNNPSPAQMHVCSPQLLLREGGAMSIDGIYKVAVRASGEGPGRYSEILLKISWDGKYVESLGAELWPSENT